MAQSRAPGGHYSRGFLTEEEKANRPVLRDVSFTLKAGHSIAIVGPSGAGKTTIINLIPRLYDVTGGRVTFDGVDLRKLDLGFLRAQIGMVSQDTYLFNGTIRENLLYARHGAGEAEMVFIFDEATSSLDSMSEKEIQEAIEPIIRRAGAVPRYPGCPADRDLVHTGLTYCLYFSSLKELPGQEAAILSYIDPLVAVLISVAFFREAMTLKQAVGIGLILGFTLWNELSPKGGGAET